MGNLQQEKQPLMYKGINKLEGGTYATYQCPALLIAQLSQRYCKC